LGRPGTLVLVSFDGLPNWLQNVSRQAVMLDLLSYTDKELTNSLLLASDWLTILAISVCDLVWQREIHRRKSQYDQQNSSPFINPWG